MNQLQQTVLALTSGQWWIDQRWALANTNEMAQLLATAGSTQAEKPKTVQAVAYSASVGVSNLQNAPDGSVAVIAIRGGIVKYGNYYAIGSKEYISLLNSIYGDKRFVGTVLIVDSPGGMAAGTRELYQTVANPVKPTVSLIDTMAASAAYYAIAGSNAIYTSQPNDIVGSIGTYAMLADFKAYFEKAGLPIYEVYADQSTEKNLDVRQLFAKKDDTLLKAELTQSNQIFINDVKEARAGKLNSKAGDPFKGAIYLADQAQAVGLTDGSSTLADALAEVSDRFSISKRKSTNMNLIQELQALLGKATKNESEATDATTPEQQIAALTQERDNAQAQVSTLTTQVTTLTTERDNAQTQVTNLTTQVSTLTTERDTAQAEVARLGKQPGEKPTPKATTETVEKDSAQKTPQQILNELPHNQAADALFGAE